MGDGETDADLEPRPNGDSLTGGDSDELLPIAWGKKMNQSIKKKGSKIIINCKSTLHLMNYGNQLVGKFIWL